MIMIEKVKQLQEVPKIPSDLTISKNEIFQDGKAYFVNPTRIRTDDWNIRPKFLEVYKQTYQGVDYYYVIIDTKYPIDERDVEALAMFEKSE